MTLDQLHKNKIISTSVLIAFFFWQSNIVFAQAVINNALPQNHNTVVGSATYDYSVANTLTQTSTTNVTATDWNGGMNVGAVNTWNINQPTTGSVWLNRDVSGNPTQIWGAVKSNARVMFENANGIFLGSSSNIDVAGLVGSTLHISNNDFSNGNYKFYQNKFDKDGNPVYSYVVNQGNIQVTNGGYVLLLGGAVSNGGSILANKGKVVLASGQQMDVVGLDDNNDISVTINEAVQNAVFGPDGNKMTNAVENTGTIQADAGHIILTAKVLNHIFDYAVNNSGVIQANSLSNKNGVIELTGDGGDVITKKGSLISAKAGDSTSSGGKVKLYSTKNTTVEDGSTIDVSGGSQAGDGGNVDLSAKDTVIFAGTLNGWASKGYHLGKVIIDPFNATLSGNINADTTVWATNDVTINGNVILGNNVTLNIFADHNSPTASDWEDGIGAIVDTGGYTISGNGTGILNMQAGSGIGSLSNSINVSGLSSVSAAINPTNGSGGIYISNSGAQALTVSSATTRNGDIALTSVNSSIALTGLVNAGTGNITLDSAGSITQGSGPITATTLNATAVNNISLGQIGNKVDVLDAHSTGTGNISFNDSKNVTLDNVTTNNGHIWAQIDIGGTGNITAKNVQANNAIPDTSVLGDVFIGAWNGNVLVNNVSAGTNGTAQFQATGGSIIGQNTNANYDVTAKTVVLNATNGINGLDSNNALRTQTSNINAIKQSSSTSGDINISNTANGTDPLTLTSFTPAGVTRYAWGVANNNGNINIQTNTSLVTAKDVQTPMGNVNLKATGANSDINVIGGVYGGYGAGGFGNIAMNAGGNVTSGANPIKTTGIVTINAGKSISTGSGPITTSTLNTTAVNNITIGSTTNQIDTVNAQSTGTGDITITNNKTIVLNNLTTNNGHIWAHTQTGDITANNVQANNAVPNTTATVGDVFVGTYNGNAYVNNVSAGSNGTAYIQATGVGGLIQNANSTGAGVSGKTVVLWASHGIGVNSTTGIGVDPTNGALRTQTSNINAFKTSTSSQGDINIVNTAIGTNPLTLTSFTPANQAYGVANNFGDINITTNSSLITAKDVQTPKGNVNLTTTGTNSDITVNGGVYGGYGAGGFGNISLNAGGNVVQASGTNPIKTTGTVSITAGKDISQISGSILANTANFVAGQNIGSSAAINTTVNNISANAGGLINLNQTGDVIINNLTSNTGSITFNGSGKVNVGAGGIHSNVHDITLNTADALTLNGDVDAGENGAAISLNVQNGGVQQNSGSVVGGNLNLSGNGDFNLSDSTNYVDTLVTNISGRTSYTDLEAPIAGVINGNIGITTTNGNVTMNAKTNGIVQSGNSSLVGGLVVSGNGGFTLFSSNNNVSSHVDIQAGSSATVHYENLNASSLPVNLVPVFGSSTTQTAAFLNNRYVLPVITELPNVQINTFDSISSSIQAGPVFLYHPLTQLDSGAFNDQFQLDQGAYDFIDDEIKKKKGGSS